MKLWLAVLTAWLASSTAAIGQDRPFAVSEWTVEGERRQAVVIAPAKAGDGPAPVLLVFHGHGGTMRFMARKGFQREWPEAIVVCPQGLPTATPRDPEGKKAGWQVRAGTYGDRDLKFVDAILKSLREKYRVDDSRVYATGHSNGGAFTYLLWAERGKEFAALAPSSAPGAVLLAAGRDLGPLPVLHLAGEKDEIVSYEVQQRTMEGVRKILRCEPEGKAWADAGPLKGTIYPSKAGPPFISLIHPGGHEFPAEAPGLIVKFFKEQVRK